MKLQLTTEQVNQILSALAQQPYLQVYELINTIRQQGQDQLQNGQANALTVEQPQDNTPAEDES